MPYSKFENLHGRVFGRLTVDASGRNHDAFRVVGGHGDTDDDLKIESRPQLARRETFNSMKNHPRQLKNSRRRVALLKWVGQSQLRGMPRRKDFVHGFTPNGAIVVAVYRPCDMRCHVHPDGRARRKSLPEPWGVFRYYSQCPDFQGHYGELPDPRTGEYHRYPSRASAMRAAQGWWRAEVEGMLEPARR